MKSENRPPNQPPSPDQPSKGSENPGDLPPQTPASGESQGANSPDTPAEPVRGADISGILGGWSYNPDQINARRIIADDGEERIQVRLDLGILQMHVTGRPDGSRPMGFESLLEYYEHRLDESEQETRERRETRDPRPGASPEGGSEPEGREAPAEDLDEEEGAEPPDADAKSDTENSGEEEAAGNESVESKDGDSGDGRPAKFELSSDDCQALREEAVQYYHRYVAMMALEDFYGVIRDTTRNLRVLDLCREHAADESDQEFLEQFRPYILMVRARALASQAISNNEPKAALHAIDEALDALKRHFDMGEEPNAFDMSGEVQMLRTMRDSLVPKLPVSPMAELRARLAKAIETENYELAAILRDELKQMKE